jgi:anti-sigma regulatory factor (Ser/Thr protein kinase)
MPESRQPTRPVTLHADNAGDLVSVRQVVARASLTVGVEPDRADGFVVAVNEIVTNALTHGLPPATITISSTGMAVQVAVHDRGGFGDPYPAGAGHVGTDPVGQPPATDRPNGRGLWLASQLSDHLDIRTDTNGTTVTVRLHRRPWPP